jgi:hypothetical protein
MIGPHPNPLPTNLRSVPGEGIFYSSLFHAAYRIATAFYIDNINQAKNTAMASKTKPINKPNMAFAVSESLLEIQMIKPARAMPTGKVQYHFKPKSNDACHEAGLSGSWTMLAMDGQTAPAKRERKTNANPCNSAILYNFRPVCFSAASILFLSHKFELYNRLGVEVQLPPQ